MQYLSLVRRVDKRRTLLNAEKSNTMLSKHYNKADKRRLINLAQGSSTIIAEAGGRDFAMTRYA